MLRCHAVIHIVRLLQPLLLLRRVPLLHRANVDLRLFYFGRHCLLLSRSLLSFVLDGLVDLPVRFELGFGLGDLVGQLLCRSRVNKPVMK